MHTGHIDILLSKKCVHFIQSPKEHNPLTNIKFKVSRKTMNCLKDKIHKDFLIHKYITHFNFSPLNIKRNPPSLIQLYFWPLMSNTEKVRNNLHKISSHVNSPQKQRSCPESFHNPSKSNGIFLNFFFPDFGKKNTSKC